MILLFKVRQKLTLDAPMHTPLQAAQIETFQTVSTLETQIQPSRL